LVLIALTWGTSVAARDEQVEILRPNGAGSVTNILGQQPCLGEHWDKVAEVNADDDGSYVWVYQAHEGQDLYSLSNPSGTGVITKVRIYVRGKTDYIGSIKTLIKTHGTSYYDPLMVLPFEYNDWPLTTNYETYHTEYTQNPYTGSAWTWDEIETLEAGVFLFVLSPVPTPGGPESQCTQVYVQVCYTISSGGNQLPVADVGGPYIGNEGSSITFDASGSYDPDGDPLVYQWDFDNDGIWDTEWSSIPTASYTSGDDWSGTAMVEVSDGELTDTDTASVTVNNVAPTADLGNDGPKDEGSAVTVSFSNQYDPGTSDTFTYSFDWDNDGTYDVVDQAGASAQHTWYDEGTGTYTVKGMIKDNDGGYTEYTTDVMVNNVAPTVDAGQDQTVDEGDTVSFLGSFTDLGWLDTHIIEWDFGDGGTATGTLTPTHAYGDNDVYTVTLTVTDDDGGIGTDDTLTVTVNNIAPTVGEISAPLGPVSVGTVVSASAGFTDPGFDETYIAEWNWGDDFPSTGAIRKVEDAYSVTGSHTYDTPGIYTITLTVNDGFKSTSATFQFVVVYDPVGGFVTGGGWIDSPAGAYTPDPSLTGKATFGFVSKYKKGAVTPTGVTEFHFKVADLNFHSDSYDWLVIAGHKAIYKGTGTIDGDGDYGFMLSAIDEKLTPRTDVDMFRIKIWDKDDGDAVVYDNNIGNDDDADLTTEIAGGQIVIHKAKAK
jgi:PKD repeat protein